MRILLFLSLCLALFKITAIAGDHNGPYVDPMLVETLQTEAHVRVLINLRGGELPPDLPEDRLERGRAISEFREEQYQSAKYELMKYLGGESECFQINEEIPRSLTLVARVQGKETLQMLIRFGRIQSLHYADRKLTR